MLAEANILAPQFSWPPPSTTRTNQFTFATIVASNLAIPSSASRPAPPQRSNLFGIQKASLSTASVSLAPNPASYQRRESAAPITNFRSTAQATVEVRGGYRRLLQTIIKRIDSESRRMSNANAPFEMHRLQNALLDCGLQERDDESSGSGDQPPERGDQPLERDDPSLEVGRRSQ
jgi:hypothetical protein